MISATLLHDMWVTVGAIYMVNLRAPGIPTTCCIQSKFCRQHPIAAQVCLQSSGLRVVAGDFNVGEDDVTAFNILHASGFKDLQSDGDVRSPTLAGRQPRLKPVLGWCLKALPGLISATLAQNSNSCSFRFLWTMVCGQTMRFWRVSSRDPIVLPVPVRQHSQSYSCSACPKLYLNIGVLNPWAFVNFAPVLIPGTTGFGSARCFPNTATKSIPWCGKLSPSYRICQFCSSHAMDGACCQPHGVHSCVHFLPSMNQLRISQGPCLRSRDGWTCSQMVLATIPACHGV